MGKSTGGLAVRRRAALSRLCALLLRVTAASGAIDGRLGSESQLERGHVAGLNVKAQGWLRQGVGAPCGRGLGSIDAETSIVPRIAALPAVAVVACLVWLLVLSVSPALASRTLSPGTGAFSPRVGNVGQLGSVCPHLRARSSRSARWRLCHRFSASGRLSRASIAPEPPGVGLATPVASPPPPLPTQPASGGRGAAWASPLVAEAGKITGKVTSSATKAGIEGIEVCAKPVLVASGHASVTTNRQREGRDQADIQRQKPAQARAFAQADGQRHVYAERSIINQRDQDVHAEVTKEDHQRCRH